jgi:hypothetical protein
VDMRVAPGPVGQTRQPACVIYGTATGSSGGQARAGVDAPPRDGPCRGERAGAMWARDDGGQWPRSHKGERDDGDADAVGVMAPSFRIIRDRRICRSPRWRVVPERPMQRQAFLI